MSTFFVTVVPLLLGALAAYLLVGRGGPVYQRRFGALTFPDYLWTVPLVLTLAAFWGLEWVFAPRHSSLFGLAICSFSICILTAVAYGVFSSWTLSLPKHLQPLTYARLGAQRYRMIVRTTLWQGLLAGVLDGTPVSPAWLPAMPGYLYLLAILPLLMTVLGRAWSKSRYGRTCYRKESRGFDVFVSYKSEGVDAARRITDLALANHLKPWFAEYLIRLHSRDRFQEAITRGIANSRTGIIFTSSGYFKSSHCLTEMRQLVEKNGSSGIIEVYLPGETRIADWCVKWEQDKRLKENEETRWAATHLTELRRIPSVAVIDYEGVSNALREVLDLGIEDKFVHLADSESETRFRGEHSGIPFSLQTTGWQEVTAPGSGGVINRDLKMTPGFKRDFGYGSVVWEVVLGPVVRRVLDPEYDEIPPLDDDHRWLYNEYRDSAMLWLAKNAAECHGVHLFWFAQGERRPHLLITHWGERMWHRRYAIALEHETLEKPATFSFAFYFKGTFEDYCRHTPLMDATVRSLKWER